jgi:type 1 glutamine amidotransferase
MKCKAAAMFWRLSRIAAALSVLALCLHAADSRSYYFQKDAIRVLILSGRNNHEWRLSTSYMKSALEKTGRFDVRVEEEPEGLSEASLAPYDVLVVDYCGPRWGDVTEKAVESFVRSGKGLVAIHAASYTFGDQVILAPRSVPTGVFEPVWPEWRRMLGVYWDRDHDPRTGHASRYTFRLKFADPGHPILKGLDEDLYATDEFYTKFHYEPGVNVHVIATAWDDPQFGGTGKEEPVLMTTEYGRGRIFHTILGHDLTALMERGFTIPFLRGTEWAATGKVTLPVSGIGPQAKPTRVLTVTGGHGFSTSFYSVFDGYDDVVWDHATSAALAFQSDIREKYDVLALYDLTPELSEEGKQHLREFVESGKGVVVIHHAIADYNSWTWWWQEVVGGRYLLKPENGIPASTYKEGEELIVRPTAERHPILAGVGPMHLKDEAYKGMWISKEAKILLTTTNPNSDGPVAWVSPYPKSRVVYIQLGHGSEAHRYPAYRQLVRNAILWSGGRQSAPER